MNAQKYELLEQALKLTLQVMDLNSKDIRDFAPHTVPKDGGLGTWQFIRDFRMVRLDAGQRSGKSHLMYRMIQDGDILVTAHEQLFLNAKEESGGKNFIPFLYKQIDSPRGAAYLGEISPNSTIWCDEASWYLPREKLERLLRFFCRYDTQRAVLLG